VDKVKVKTMDIIKKVIRNKLHPHLNQLQINKLVEENVRKAKEKRKDRIKFLKRNVWKNRLHPKLSQLQINQLCE